MRSRALALGTRPGPPGVMTPDVLRPDNPQLRVHRRVIMGYAAGPLAPATWGPDSLSRHSKPA